MSNWINLFAKKSIFISLFWKLRSDGTPYIMFSEQMKYAQQLQQSEDNSVISLT